MRLLALAANPAIGEAGGIGLHVDHLARLAGANRVDLPGGQTCLCSPARPGEELEAYCRESRLDFFFQPGPADIRLAALDMDSTTITCETIDAMAGCLGLREEIAPITAAAMRGEIDFATSLRRRVALFAGAPESLLDEIIAQCMVLSPGVEALVADLKATGAKVVLISGGFTRFTAHLGSLLGLDAAFGNELEIENGKLTGRLSEPILDTAAKAAILARLRDEAGLAREQTLAVGDGANDLAMLGEAGIGVAWRAEPKLREGADLVLDHADLSGLLALTA